jgi:hypothetical protein
VKDVKRLASLISTMFQAKAAFTGDMCRVAALKTRAKECFLE